MSKIKSNLILSGEFQTLTRDELKSVVGGNGPGWCLWDSMCGTKSLACGGEAIAQLHGGNCYRAHWWSRGTCTYPSCPEIGPLISLESF